MFKPVRWKTFLRDMLRIQLGFAMFGAAIAMLIRANLGTSAWAVLEVALAQIFHLTPGTVSVLVGFLVLIVALLLRERIGWGTVANILCIGPFEDFALWLVPSIRDNLPLQIVMLLLATALMGLASAVYIGVDAGAGPRDSLMLAIGRTTGWSVRVSRGLLELAVVITGWLLGGPAGLGTVVFAVLIGPAVQAAFKLLDVQPHRAVDAEVEDG
jgi:uncharacterized membrane protein YczE